VFENSSSGGTEKEEKGNVEVTDSEQTGVNTTGSWRS
jgi:hypothetical protein